MGRQGGWGRCCHQVIARLTALTSNVGIKGLLRSVILREPQHTPAAYPRPPQTLKWKEFLHKQMVEGLGYVPGVCWKILWVIPNRDLFIPHGSGQVDGCWPAGCSLKLSYFLNLALLQFQQQKYVPGDSKSSRDLFLSPMVWGHQQLFRKGHVFGIPKRSQRMARCVFFVGSKFSKSR